MSYEHLSKNHSVADRLNEINSDIHYLAENYDMEEYLKEELVSLFSQVDELVTAIYPG